MQEALCSGPSPRMRAPAVFAPHIGSADRFEGFRVSTPLSELVVADTPSLRLLREPPLPLAAGVARHLRQLGPRHRRDVRLSGGRWRAQRRGPEISDSIHQLTIFTD